MDGDTTGDLTGAPSPDTATTAAARDHARSQAERARVDGTDRWSRTVPPSLAGDLPPGVGPRDVLWAETVAGGNYAIGRLPRHARLRLRDIDGDTCVQLLVFSAADTAERLNVADTVKVQWQAYLSQGQLLLSDMGRVLMSITADTSGGHDTFAAMSNRAWNEGRYGSGSVHSPFPNARDMFAVALAKEGLGRVDIAPAVNLFKPVMVEPDGSFTWHAERCVAGAEVELRAEMDVLVAMTVTPHVLDPRPAYEVGPLDVLAWRGPPTPPDDPVRNNSPEARRAFENTDARLLVTTHGGEE